MVVLLDLVLLKPRAFLHLLYNRGTPPLDAEKRRIPDDGSPQDIVPRAQKLNSDLTRLAAATVIGETMMRFLPAIRNDEHIAISAALATCIGVVVELSFQLAASTGLAVVLLWMRGWLSRPKDGPGAKARNETKEELSDGRRRDFRSVPRHRRCIDR